MKLINLRVWLLELSIRSRSQAQWSGNEITSINCCQCCASICVELVISSSVVVRMDAEEPVISVAETNAKSCEYLDNPFKDLSEGSFTPESTVRGSGSEGYLGDDDGDLSSTIFDESEDEKPLMSVSSQNSRNSSILSKRSS